MRGAVALALVLLVSLAGCSSPFTDDTPTPSPSVDETATPDAAASPASTPVGTGTTGDAASTASESTAGEAATTPPPLPVAGGADRNATAGPPPDPAHDVVGWENGYWYDESIDVDPRDGLSEAERRAYVNRTMARVEFLRGLEFRTRVSLSIVSRSSYRQEVLGEGTSHENATGSHARWTNQLWEALFVVGEGTDATVELRKLYAAGVQGFYAPGSVEVVIVSPGERGVVDNGTLAHELVHVLQDQHFDLSRVPLRGVGHDGELAASGLVEGDAAYVEQRYVNRCGRAWDCVPTPPTTGFGGAAGRASLGMVMTVLQPYSDGPAYVDSLYRRGGWAAVNARFDDPPGATEAVIHPDRSDTITGVHVPDTARDGWTRFDEGVDGAETVGEASIFVLFWWQATHYRIDDGVAVGALFDTDAPFDQYNYDATPSAGWAGDALVPYRRGDEFGYVWTTAWDTARDAGEFRDAYLAVLRGHGAVARGPNAWVVPDGDFADAFRVVRHGRRVTVVNAPTAAELDEVHPTSVSIRTRPGNETS